MELIVKKCMKCGAEVEVLKDCTCNDCGIVFGSWEYLVVRLFPYVFPDDYLGNI